MKPTPGRIALALGATAATALNAMAGDGKVERVSGVMCQSPQSSIRYLDKLAEGKNDLIAANEVSKETGVMGDCITYMRGTQGVISGEKDIRQDGRLFKVTEITLVPDGKKVYVSTWFGTAGRELAREADI